MRRGLIKSVVLVLVGACPISGQATPNWTLATPHFEIGGVEAEGEYELAELGGVTILENGNVVVGDRIQPFLKVFSSDGSFLRTIGRDGKGPGEYKYVYDMDWCSPGELHVRDVDRRIHRYVGDMEYVATDLLSLDPIGGGTGYQHDCHPNGYRIATGWGNTRAQFREGLFVATAPSALLRTTALVKDLGERLSSERLGSVGPEGAPLGSGPHPFGRATVVALGSDLAFVGDGTAYSIEVYDLDGNPTSSIVWDGPSLAYRSDLVDRVADQAVAAARERARPALRRWYAEMPSLDQLPAYDRLLVSDTDELWVRQFVRPGSVGEDWVVFDREQKLTGRLQLPLRAKLWEVRGEDVVYSILDEYDVPIVRISRVRRP